MSAENGSLNSAAPHKETDDLVRFLRGETSTELASGAPQPPVVLNLSPSKVTLTSDEEMLDLTPGQENPFRDPYEMGGRSGTSHQYETVIGDDHDHDRDSEFSDVGSNSHLLDNGESFTEGHYEDFETIDWLKDIGRYRKRHRDILRKTKANCRGKFYAFLDGGSGWLCVALIGIAAALVAGIVDVGATWMGDLKLGICTEAFWLNKEQCCWSSNETDIDYHYSCNQWYTWGELAHIHDRFTWLSYFLEYLMYILWAVFFAMLAALLVKNFAPYACGSGIPEIKTILSGFVIRGYLGKWTLLIKSIGIMLSVSAGLNLGKEGPMVHISSCVGNVVAYLFPKYGRNEAKKREVLSAATAAGVAVAFGAPLGGVLFALEEASYYFPLKTLWRSFFCSMVAAYVGKLLNPFGNEHLVLFYVDYRTPWYMFEIVPFMFLGVIGGVFGAIFIRANVWVCSQRKFGKLGQYPLTEVCVVTLITSLLAFPNFYTRMSSSEMIKILFSQCGPEDKIDLCQYIRNSSNVKDYLGSVPADKGIYTALWKLALAFLFKVVMVIFTFGIKVPCGLFIPSLAIGAAAGRILGNLIEMLAVANMEAWPFKAFCKVGQPCINPGLYAMIGAAAALGGVTRMTLSLVAIMLELTGSMQYIIPLMIASMTAKWVGDRLTNGGIYEEHIKLNGYPFLDNKEEFTHTTIAADVMRPRRGDPPIQVLFENGMSVEDVELLLHTADVNGFPVVVSEESHYLIGFVTRRDLNLALEFSRKHEDGIVSDSIIHFSDMLPNSKENYHPPNKPMPLKLRRIVDLSPITVTDQTPMETVLEMFRKLGLRQTLVTHNGKLLGIITKKDILRHIEYLQNIDPNNLMFS